MTPEQKQLIREKINEQFKSRLYHMIRSYKKGQETCEKEFLDDLKSFFQSELDLAIKQTEERIVEKIEQLPVFQGETNFNDGGDSEYADRRIAVDNSRRRGQNEMKQSIITLIRNK